MSSHEPEVATVKPFVQTEQVVGVEQKRQLVTVVPQP